MRNLSRSLTYVLLASLLLLSLSGCAAKREAPPGELSGTIAASGSTAILHLVSAAKELFEEQHEWVTVNVSGGGSFNGMAQVSSGAVNIGNSDVPATEKYPGLVDHRVAVAPFLFAVNQDVTAENVTMEQLAAILRGEITNWKEVGGRDQNITVVSRQQSSGSRATVIRAVLQNQGDITRNAVIMDSNGKVWSGVISTPGAIGYVDAPYYKPEEANSLKINGVPYSPEAVINGQWPVYSYGHMFTQGEATGLTKEFLDFILSEKFQLEYVQQLGFIPIAKMKVQQ